MPSLVDGDEAGNDDDTGAVGTSATAREDRRGTMTTIEGQVRATGRRKGAVAQVIMTPGSGQIVVNGRVLDEYFKREVLVIEATLPLTTTETRDRFDVRARLRGGGLSGQAGALRLGLSRALTQAMPDLHPTLRKGGFLTRDGRAKERKKYGQPGARKRFQFSKR
jgi:small subunit ribosomal protein S9